MTAWFFALIGAAAFRRRRHTLRRCAPSPRAEGRCRNEEAGNTAPASGAPSAVDKDFVYGHIIAGTVFGLPPSQAASAPVSFHVEYRRENA